MALTWNTAGTISEALDYRVEISFLSPAAYTAAGYGPDNGWHIQFTRGGCGAGAYHATLPEAQVNAERIVNSLRGTHDDFGNPRKVAR